MSAEASTLATDYYPMALKVAKHWAGVYPYLRDEIRSEALYALMRAAVDYDGRVPFPGFAHNRIRFALCDMLKAYRKRVQQFKVYRRATGPNLRVEADHAIEAERVDLCRRLLEVPVGVAGDVARIVFGEGESQSEAARRLGFSKCTASRLMGLAIEDMRNYCDRVGIEAAP